MRRTFVPVAVVGALALAGCGSGSNTPSAEPSVDIAKLGSAGAGQDPTATGPVTIPGATKGGVVNVISDSGLESMDPSDVYYTNTSSILGSLVTRSLTQYKYDPSTKDMVLVPDLATNLGTHNPDFTSWSFTIRPGVKFENGQTVTPQDVVYGIERSFDRSTFPDGPSYSNEYFLDGNSYKGPYKDKAPYKGITVTGNTITIKMSQPFPDMPYYASFPEMGPIPKTGSSPTAYAKHPLSTGPYMFKSYTPEKSLVLVKNPYWNPATDPGRTQYPDEYDFDFQTPSNKIDAIMGTSKNGGADTLSYDNILAGDLRSFDQSRLVTGGTPCTDYWAPDNRKITNIKVRQAIAYAYPYQAATLAAGGIPGVTTIRDQGENLMPPGVPGRTKYTVDAGLPGTTNTAKAKQLLQQAGATGYTLKWLYAQDDPISVQVTKVREQAFKAAGFNPQPIASTIGQIGSQTADPNGPENLRSAGWCSDWPSGASWFPPVLHSTDLKTTGLGQNDAAFENPTVDAQMTKIQTLPLAQQPTAWNALDKQITAKYFPLFITAYEGTAMMRGEDVEGMNDDPVFGMPTWKDVWLKQ